MASAPAVKTPVWVVVLAAPLILTLLANLGALIYWAGITGERIDAMSRRLNSMQSVTRAIAAVDRRLTVIETLVDAERRLRSSSAFDSDPASVVQ